MKTKVKKFSKKALKAEIINQYGSIENLKNHLKNNAVFEYGCFTNYVKVYGCQIGYTSNKNHFCEFFINIPQVGFCNTLALGKESITRAGRKRGAGKSYITL